MQEKPNILLITIDTLRADHLGCYGYRWPTSPCIDALAGEGVLCEQMICPGIPTQPSYTTLYTGQHPLTHGIIGHSTRNKLSREAPFLSQLLLEAGYTTCAVDNLMRQRLWLGRGFEYYIDPSVRHLLFLAVTCEEINDRAIRWLRTHADEPFFMLIHYWDPHTPYTPPERYRGMFYEGNNPTDPNNDTLARWWHTPLGSMARDTWLHTADGRITDPAYITALYDQEIRYVDEAVGQIINVVDELGLAGRTLVVVMADHGESLTEHNIFFDHYGLYECTVRIPFIAWWPGRLPWGVRLSPLLQVSDIAPTLLEAAGVQVPHTVEGQSFWPLLTGETDRGGHRLVVSVECTWQAAWSLRTERYKFILPRHQDGDEGGRELYDLHADPAEEHNLVEQEPELAKAMEAELEGWIQNRLRALGKEKDPLLEQSGSLRQRLGWIS